MYSQNHPASAALIAMGAMNAKPTKAMLDSAELAKQAILDATGEAVAKHASDGIRSAGLVTVLEWLGTPDSDLEEGETQADRLLAMFIGIADDNKDGEIDSEEADVIEIAMNTAADYLSTKGVSDEDIVALLEEQDEEASARVRELLGDELGASDEAMAEIDAFVFDADSSESVLDGVLDAVYKKKMVVRKGKKVRINKRVSGKVRLSAAQKVSIRKATRKAHTAGARVRRMKSMKVRARSGL